MPCRSILVEEYAHAKLSKISSSDLNVGNFFFKNYVRGDSSLYDSDTVESK